MLSLIYVSTASDELTLDEVEAMAAHSAESNALAQITGMLAFNSRGFMQLLEGNGSDVLAVMRKIERDPRHTNISYIRQDERRHRECPDWSMRSLITPLTGIGSASLFTKSLPKEMELDTRILFTSFASVLNAHDAAQFATREHKLTRTPDDASND